MFQTLKVYVAPLFWKCPNDWFCINGRLEIVKWMRELPAGCVNVHRQLHVSSKA